MRMYEPADLDRRPGVSCPGSGRRTALGCACARRYTRLRASSGLKRYCAFSPTSGWLNSEAAHSWPPTLGNPHRVGPRSVVVARAERPTGSPGRPGSGPADLVYLRAPPRDFRGPARDVPHLQDEAGADQAGFDLELSCPLGDRPPRCRQVPHLPPGAGPDDGVRVVDMCGSLRHRSTGSRKVSGRLADGREVLAAASRQSQPAARRFVFHGAGQLAPRRGDVSSERALRDVHVRRLREAALCREDEPGPSANRHQGDLR